MAQTGALADAAVIDEAVRNATTDAIYIRRDRLWLHYDHKARTWAKEFLAGVPIGDLVDNCIEAFGRVEEADQNQQHRVRNAALLVLAGALARNRATQQDARALAAAGVAGGTAEGTAAANALYAYANLLNAPDMAAEKRATAKHLRNLATYWDKADSIVSDQIKGLAGDLGPTLAKMIEQGASRSELETATARIIGQADGAAIYLDVAIQTAYVKGGIEAYKNQGVQTVEYVGMDDGRMCELCIGFEAGSPYSIDDVPEPPTHIGCRCWLVPEGVTDLIGGSD